MQYSCHIATSYIASGFKRGHYGYLCLIILHFRHVAVTNGGKFKIKWKALECPPVALQLHTISSESA